ncbi:hypothetical protein RHGRI_016504 [Rhododendron griersonianum]|uniref:Uncharacterized protein n=1 Tax=Rhododendron griersonianum TaxID=479676 RepID=A0AAV6JUE9_9ERIC|nr:hypothetical protein RHGRI_016504 [Rhododendron griersonianum]
MMSAEAAAAAAWPIPMERTRNQRPIFQRTAVAVVESDGGGGGGTSGHKKGFGSMSPRGVKLQIQDRHVVIDNGIFQVTLSNPAGIVTGISYNGIDNLLEVLNDESNRGISGTKFEVIKETEEQVEVSFSRPWEPSLQGKLVPLNIDKRFIVLRGSSGFYSYAIYEHLGLPEWPAFSLGETRIAFKLRKEKFHYMAVADNRRRFMPLPDDRLPGRGQPLAYPEAVLLVNPKEPELKGEVDDKYQYSCENKDLRVHGWISVESPPVGFWQITPSDEFRSGGPLKQNLSSHVGPTCLAVSNLCFSVVTMLGMISHRKLGRARRGRKFSVLFSYISILWWVENLEMKHLRYGRMLKHRFDLTSYKYMDNR